MKENTRELLIYFTITVTILALIKTSLVIYDIHKSRTVPNEFALEQLEKYNIDNSLKEDVAKAYTIFRNSWKHGSPSSTSICNLCENYDYYTISTVINNFEKVNNFQNCGTAYYDISGSLLASTTQFPDTIINTSYFIKAVEDVEDLERYNDYLYYFSMPVYSDYVDAVIGVVVFKYKPKIETEVKGK